MHSKASRRSRRTSSPTTGSNWEIEIAAGQLFATSRVAVGEDAETPAAPLTVTADGGFRLTRGTRFWCKVRGCSTARRLEFRQDEQAIKPGRALQRTPFPCRGHRRLRALVPRVQALLARYLAPSGRAGDQGRSLDHSFVGFAGTRRNLRRNGTAIRVASVRHDASTRRT